MALSGSFYTNVGSHWRLQMEWSATQNTTNNTSTVTAKLYWMALDGYGAVYSSASKTCGIQHDDGSWVTTTAADMAALDANQKKLIQTYTFTLTHNSDGSKSFSLDGYFDAQVTLGSTYYSTINLTQTTFTLNTIPREWTLSSSSLNFTAGNSLPMSFNVTSSSFTVTVEVLVNGVSISSKSGISTSSYTYTFSALDTQNIFVQLNKDTTSWNQYVTVNITTYNGSTKIGSTKTYTNIGTCSSPAVTQITVPDFTIGNSVTATMSSEQNSAFVYDLTATIGSYTKTLLTKGGYQNVAWATSGDATSLYGQIPSSKTGTVTFTLTTYWANGTTYTKVRTADTDTAIATVPSTQVPTFAPSGANALTYADTNSAVTAVTGFTSSAAYHCIVQGKSTLVVTLPSGGLATAASGTTISKYTCTFNGLTKNNDGQAITATQTFTFTATDLASAKVTQNATVTVTDARGYTTSATLSITVIPYTVPAFTTVSATRDDGFSNPVTIKLAGNISPVNVNGTNKNSVKTMVYNWSLSGKNSWQASDTAFTAATATFPNFAANDVHDATTFSNSAAWDIKITVTDQLGSYTVTKTVGVGTPIFFIDSGKNSVSVNQLPVNSNSFELTGNMYVKSGNIYMQGAGVFRTAIELKAGADNTGDGLAIGADGMTVIGGGESPHNYINNATMVPNAATEKLVLTSDNQIEIYTGMQSATTTSFSSDPVVTIDNGAINAIINHTSGYLTIGAFSSTYGSGSGRIWYNATNATYNFWDTGSASANITSGDITCGDLHSADIYLNSRTIIMTTPGNYDQIWFNDSTNEYWFLADAASSKATTGAGILRASAFTTVSDENLKTDIQTFEEDAKLPNRAIDYIAQSPVYTYRYKHDIETEDRGRRVVPKRIGLIAQQAPEEIRGVDGDSIDLYAMNAFMWKAIQELATEVEYLEKKLKNR